MVNVAKITEAFNLYCKLPEEKQQAADQLLDFIKCHSAEEVKELLLKAEEIGH